MFSKKDIYEILALLSLILTVHMVHGDVEWIPGATAYLTIAFVVRAAKSE